MKKTFRTFVAVEISGPIRARAAGLIAALQATAADVKWVEPHNLHLTLKFLGEVHQRDIAALCQAVSRGAAEVEPFALEVRGAGAFPTAARPRTVWLGAAEGAEQMVVLHDRVEDVLAELGYRKEHRRFQTHLTDRPSSRRRAGHRRTGNAAWATGRRLDRPDERREGNRLLQHAHPCRSDL